MTVVIFGAGEIGASTARQLAASGVVRRLVLVDEAATVARGKALDIAQAAPVDRYDTALAGTDDESAVAGAQAAVLADRAGGAGEWADEAGLALVRRIASLNPIAPLVCAGASQRRVIDRAVHELGLPRTRIFGTAPEALRAALVSLVALDAETPPSQIGLLVLGRPPRDLIVPWDGVTLGGRRALDLLSPAVIARLDDRAGRLWPPGPFTLAAAAARVVRTMATRAPYIHVVEAAVTREEGGGGAVARPAALDPRGLLRIETPALSARDRVRFESALAR